MKLDVYSGLYGLTALLSAHVTFYAERLDLFAWCVRISRLSVGFRTLSKSMQFHLQFTQITFVLADTSSIFTAKHGTNHATSDINIIT